MWVAVIRSHGTRPKHFFGRIRKETSFLRLFGRNRVAAFCRYWKAARSKAQRAISPHRSLIQPTNNVSGITYLPPSVPALADESGVAVTLLPRPSPTQSNLATGRKALDLTLIVLKSDTIFAVANYRIDNEFHESQRVGRFSERKRNRLEKDLATERRSRRFAQIRS
jgi:hypothetical protein